MTMFRSTALVWLWLVALVLGLDLVTKTLADDLLPYGVPHPQLPVFDLTLLYNKGAAFSFLADAGGWQRWFFTAVAVGMSGVLLVWMYRTPRNQVWLGCALALVMAGALGNLFDRVVYGYVIDFLSFHYQNKYFPAFNFADVAISCGAFMLIVDMFRQESK
ncbi:signal peptidase II [Aliamphritea spongicola]|uniref:signal peptidase II n=1 Tax=Aliamphritea spongicola TaxID=707589 RepID=UPI00196AF5C5|nr:signal peptidase II [Aliamphritea spongicola]MBN3562471.1 signal peptidase II [Aliamphritea spongicola]